MKTADLYVAVAEARRFIIAAEKCTPVAGFEKVIDDGKNAAACKRASMDLTRALVDLRHPYRKEVTR